MRNTKQELVHLTAVLLTIVPLSGCMPEASEGAHDAADQLGKALDRDPDYVDEPAEGSQQPR